MAEREVVTIEIGGKEGQAEHADGCFVSEGSVDRGCMCIKSTLTLLCTYIAVCVLGIK